MVAAADRNRAVLQRSRALSKSAVRKLIVKTARRHGVDPNLYVASVQRIKKRLDAGWNPLR